MFSFPDGAFTPVIADYHAIYLIGYGTVYQMLPGPRRVAGRRRPRRHAVATGPRRGAGATTRARGRGTSAAACGRDSHSKQSQKQR